MAELGNPIITPLGTSPSMGYNNLCFTATKPVVFHRNDCYIGGKRVPSDDHKAPVTSAAAGTLHGRPVAVFTNRNGVGIASPDAELLGWIPAGGEVDLRGVAVTSETQIAYGSAAGQVFFVELGADFSQGAVVATDAHSAPVTCLVQGSRGLYSGDTDGMVCFFAGTDVKTKAISDGDCCTAIVEHDAGLVTAHGSGDIRVRNIAGTTRAQVTAHSRWITSMSGNARGTFASVSEDNVLAVWSFGMDEVKFVAHKTHPNQLLTGVVVEESNEVRCTAYDHDALLSYTVA